jgi:signal transduction histidine kinase
MKTKTPPPIAEIEATPKRQVHVLVLDDNPADIEIIDLCLGQMSDWDVYVTGCHSVESALETLDEQSFELLFLDYWLSANTGLEALEQLREAGAQMPTILMTGVGNDAVVVEGLKAGVVDYLPKSSQNPEAVQRASRNAIEKADLARTLEESRLSLVQTVDALQARQAEIESFYHNVSHELKTPLTASREYISLLLDGAGGGITEASREILEASLRNCDQMVTCINDMLDTSRLDTGKLTLNIDQLDLRSVIEDAIMSLRGNAKAKRVELTVTAPNYPMIVSIDRQRIYQVLANLIGNAIKFSGEASQVAVILKPSRSKYVTVQVIDSGPGLAPGDEERVFDRLYQSRTQDAATLGGLGMGLYISRQIIDLHGGTLSVESKVDRGCTFTFELPRRTVAPKPRLAS